MILITDKGNFTSLGAQYSEIKGNKLIVNGIEVVKCGKDVEIVDSKGCIVQNQILVPGTYTLKQKGEVNLNIKQIAYELIEPIPSDEIEEMGINYKLLKLLTRIKEITLVNALAKLDEDNPETLIEYDEVYLKSKNKDFIPELSPYNIIRDMDTVDKFKEIFEIRNRIYESRTDADKNHTVFGINNPVIWLDADIKIKRIACGAIQYRKGLHIREFDLMIYNLNLTNKFKLTSDKIKYAELMRDYNLL